MVKRNYEESSSSNEDDDYNSSAEDSGSDESVEASRDPQPATSKRQTEVKKQKPNNTSGTERKVTQSAEKIKPPTLKEINELKETRNLFHSNLFRLQIKEMLNELKTKEKYKKYISSWLESFTLFTRELVSEAEPQDIGELHWLKECPIQVPIALKKLNVANESAFQFCFIKPEENPYLIGAAASDVMVGPKLVVDVAVTMPAESFQHGNYLNLIYDQKRALYLAYITWKMLHSEHFTGLTEDHLQFNYYANNPLKPVLEFTPAPTDESVSNNLLFRIFVAGCKSSFKLNRFVPWNSNVRPSLFGQTDDDFATPATPHYNANVLFDLIMKENQELQNEIFATRRNLQEGLLLLKVWLQQRQLNIGFTGFHHHILAMLVVFLFKNRKLHLNMSNYQIARNVWNYLALSAWDEDMKGISLCATSSSSDAATTTHNRPTLEQFHTYYDVVFVDSSGFYNICANVSREVYQRVRSEAKVAIDTLNDMKLNSFQLIFMTKRPLYIQCDHILKICRRSILHQILKSQQRPSDRCNFAGHDYPRLLKIITTLLRKGLGQRLRAIIPMELPTTAWTLRQSAVRPWFFLHLGLILDHDHALDILDKGPQSIDDAAEEFRQFWGEKAQLRRFQDGSITETVVWGSYGDPLTKKRAVAGEIVKYLLQHHLQVALKDIEYVGGELDRAFQLSPFFLTEKLPEKYKIEQDTDAETLSVNAIRGFDDLCKKLHGLSELPLEIASIANISSVFRYCDPTPVLPQARRIEDHLYANHLLDVVIQLGVSGKWPEDLTALRALKTSFYIQIAKLLRKKHRLECRTTFGGILVLNRGYLFRIEIAHQREVALLKKMKSDRGVVHYIDSEASMAMEKRYYMLPKITGALHGLYQTYPCYGATVMIAKRWLYAQLIDDGLWPDECTELLVAAAIYYRRHPEQRPWQPQTGFYHFLQLLGNSDWKTEMFLINFNNEMEDDDISALELRFNSDRASFPPLCIVTSYDLKHCIGHVWTSASAPNVNILARVTLLARQALDVIEQRIASRDLQPFLRSSTILFTAASQGYDLVIQLKPDFVASTLATEFASPFVASTRPNFRMSPGGSNYLRDAVQCLREAYSDYAAFFYNPCGGKEIGVKWKPNIFNAREFKVTDVSGCGPSCDDGGDKIKCNQETFIEDFKVILKDFHLRIGTVEMVRKLSAASTVTTRPRNVKTKTKTKTTTTNVGSGLRSYLKRTEASQRRKRSNAKVKE